MELQAQLRELNILQVEEVDQHIKEELQELVEQVVVVLEDIKLLFLLQIQVLQ
jgi:hypothetical protein